MNEPTNKDVLARPESDFCDSPPPSKPVKLFQPARRGGKTAQRGALIDFAVLQLRAVRQILSNQRDVDAALEEVDDRLTLLESQR